MRYGWVSGVLWLLPGAAGAQEGGGTAPADPVAWIERKLGAFWKENSEVVRLEKAAASPELKGRLGEVDRSWRAAVAQGKAEPVHFKLGGIRGRNAAEQAECLEKLALAGKAGPEWRLRLGFLQLDLGLKEKASANLVAGIRQAPGLPMDYRETPLRLRVVTLVGQEEADRIDRALQSVGACRWAWELRDFAAREDRDRGFVDQWLSSAKPGEDRAWARLAEAALLWDERRYDEMKKALQAAAKEKGVGAACRSEMGPVQIPLLAKLRDAGLLAAGVLGFLRARRFDERGVGLALGWVHPDRKPIPGFTRAWDEASSGEADSAGLGMFRAGLAFYESDAEYRERMEAVARRYPKVEWILRCLGSARLKTGDYPAAAEALEEVLSAGGERSKSHRLHVDLARCYARMGRRREAVERIRIIDDERFAAYGIAVAMALDLPEEAERFHRDLARGGYGTGTARLGLSDALRALGRDDEAAEQVRTLLKESPSEVGAQCMGYFDWIAETGSGPTMARAFLSIGIVWVSWQDARRFLGLTPLMLRKVPAPERESCVAACESVSAPAEMAPLMAVVASRFHREWFGAPEKALAVLERAERKSPDSPWVVLEKGGVLRVLNRPLEMAAAYERVADLDPQGKVEDAQVMNQHLMSAMSVYQGAGRHVGVLRTGIRLLSRPEVPVYPARYVRVYLKSLFKDRGEDIWNDLREVRFERPAGDAARKIAEETGRLSAGAVEVRESAGQALRRMGIAALPSLLDLADAGDADLRSRARELVRAILTE